MTVRHVVALRWKDGTTTEHVDAITAALSTLPAHIPELRAYAFGADLGIDDGTFDFAVVADVDDDDAYRTYRDDPEHRRIIAELIKPHLAERVAVQYRPD